MRLLVSAGGTAGGVYPALAVVAELGDRAEILWVGGEGGMEKDLVDRSGIPFKGIPAAGIHGVGLRALPGNLWSLMRGTLAARSILRDFRPHAMLFTGGYVGVPVALAGWRVPKLAFIPDIQPGLALGLIGRLAQTIALAIEDSRARFGIRKRTIVTGYPTRPALQPMDRRAARTRMGLELESPVLLTFGGSRGARSINHALWGCLPELLDLTQVIHLTGELDWEEVERIRAGLPAGVSDRYVAYAYLHEEMAAAMAASDLALSRAGASSLGELPLFGLPAVLIPYPHAWRYQRMNAQYLADHGAAVVLEDSRLAQDLLPVVQDLLSDRQRLAQMANSMRGLARPGAAQAIAAEIARLAGAEAA